MALESATYIDELVASNPTSGDSAAQGDDHIRMLKAVLKATFPNLDGAMTATQDQLNAIVTTAGQTVKGKSTVDSGDTVDIDMATLKNMLGLASAAFRSDSYFALASHSHAGTYAALSHSHNASDINAGTLNPNRLPDASASEKGAVERATTAEMSSGEANKFPDALRVKEYVDAKVADATTVTIDLDSGDTKQSAAHSFGDTPTRWVAYLECTEDDGSYSEGDCSQLPGHHSASGVILGASVSVDDTNVVIRKGSGGVRLFSDAGSIQLITQSRWRLVVHIYG